VTEADLTTSFLKVAFKVRVVDMFEAEALRRDLATTMDIFTRTFKVALERTTGMEISQVSMSKVVVLSNFVAVQPTTTTTTSTTFVTSTTRRISVVNSKTTGCFRVCEHTIAFLMPLVLICRLFGNV